MGAAKKQFLKDACGVFPFCLRPPAEKSTLAQFCGNREVFASNNTVPMQEQNSTTKDSIPRTEDGHEEAFTATVVSVSSSARTVTRSPWPFSQQYFGYLPFSPESIGTATSRSCERRLPTQCRRPPFQVGDPIADSCWHSNVVMGSVAAKVLARSQVPVLLVR